MLTTYHHHAIQSAIGYRILSSTIERHHSHCVRSTLYDRAHNASKADPRDAIVVLTQIMQSCDPMLNAFDHEARAYYDARSGYTRDFPKITDRIRNKRDTKYSFPRFRIPDQSALLLTTVISSVGFSGGITEEAAERLNSCRFTSSRF